MAEERKNNHISNKPFIEKPKYFWIIIVVSWLFLSGGLFLMMKKIIVSRPKPVLTPLISESSRLEPAKEEKLREILTLYFEAYKNAKQKKNYEELKKFLSRDAADHFSAQFITDIDDYWIGEIYRPDFLVGEEEQYAGRVKIFKNGSSINPPTGESWPVFIVKENDEFKVKTWLFTLPFEKLSQ